MPEAKYKSLYEELKPVLEKYSEEISKLQKVRKVIYNWDHLLKPLSVVLRSRNGIQIAIFALVALFQLMMANVFISASVGLGLIATYFALRYSARDRLRKFKSEFIAAIFGDHEIEVSIDPQSHIDLETFQSENESVKISDIEGEDLVVGRKGNFDFQFSEVSVYRKQNLVTEIGHFQGLFMKGNYTNAWLPQFLLSSTPEIEKANYKSFLTPEFQRYFSLDFREEAAENMKKLFTLKVQNRLIENRRKFDIAFDIECMGSELFMKVAGVRDYFPLFETDDVSNYNTVKAITQDIFFFSDLINLFGEFGETHIGDDDFLELKELPLKQAEPLKNSNTDEFEL